MTGVDLRAAVPDPVDIAGASAWFAAGRAALAALEASPALVDSVGATDCATEVAALGAAAASPFGRWADPAFRRLVLAAQLADWACYAAPADQVRFDRLLHVMHTFPAGFRIWWAEAAGQGWLPVGYAGWFPIPAITFEILEARASELQDRCLPVLPAVDPAGSHVYLFNYSIVAPLRGTSASRRLMRALAAEIEALPLLGLAAITVSADGVRVAERFGMARAGTILVEGAPDHVYTRRLARGA